MTEREETDLGKPVALLAELREEPSPDFVHRLWGRIERRRLGGQLTEMSWSGAISMFVEYLDMVLQALAPTHGRTDRSDRQGD